MAVGARYTLTDYEDLDVNGHSLAGDVSIELPVEGISICPAAGVRYFRISDTEFGLTGTISSISGSVGLGIGKTFVSQASDFSVTLFGVPQVAHIREG